MLLFVELNSDNYSTYVIDLSETNSTVYTPFSVSLINHICNDIFTIKSM